MRVAALTHFPPDALNAATQMSRTASSMALWKLRAFRVSPRPERRKSQGVGLPEFSAFDTKLHRAKLRSPSAVFHAISRHCVDLGIIWVTRVGLSWGYLFAAWWTK